jgi:hypothetical protein
MVGAAPLLAPVLHLFQNDFTPLPTSVVGDFDEADFGGYGTELPVFTAPVFGPNGLISAPAGVQNFICDGTAPSNMVFGWYLLDSAGGLVMSGRFAAAKPMAANGDAITLVLFLGLSGGYGVEVIG